MAASNVTERLKSKNEILPIFQIRIADNQKVTIKKPQGAKLSENTYCINFEGQDWSGGFQDGDLVFIEPDSVGIAGDYVAIYTKENPNKPFFEKLAMSYMAEFVGHIPHPESNARPSLAVHQPNDLIRMIDLSKLHKVHKIIGRAPSEGRQNAQ